MQAFTKGPACSDTPYPWCKPPIPDPPGDNGIWPCLLAIPRIAYSVRHVEMWTWEHWTFNGRINTYNDPCGWNELVFLLPHSTFIDLSINVPVRSVYVQCQIDALAAIEWQFQPIPTDLIWSGPLTLLNLFAADPENWFVDYALVSSTQITAYPLGFFYEAG